MRLSVGGSLGLEWVSRTSLLQNVSLLPRKSVGSAAAALPAIAELAWLGSATRALHIIHSVRHLFVLLNSFLFLFGGSGPFSPCLFFLYKGFME